jgi:hypothetical protein
MNEEWQAQASVYDSILTKILSAGSVDGLNDVLVAFQNQYRLGAFTQFETTLLVNAGKKRRAELSAAEGKKSVAQEALSKAKFQGPGGVPRPNPFQLPAEERELLTKVLKVQPSATDAFAQLERLELEYMEKQRSDLGKQMLGEAFGRVLADITTAWAKKAEAK